MLHMHWTIGVLAQLAIKHLKTMRWRSLL